MNVYQLRRVAIAAVFTLAARPAVWFLDRGDTDAGSATDGSGTAIAVETTVEFTVPTTVDQLPVFLDNTAVIVPPAVIDVARPEATTATEMQGKASYRRYLQTTVVRPCTAPRAPSGALITVKALYELHRIQGKYALVTMCIGGGQGIAAIFERV